MRSATCLCGWLAAAAVVTITTIAAVAVPDIVNHQGHIKVDGIPFEGDGLFKFALVNAAGNQTYWSNDGVSVGGSEPASAVTIPVVDGTYSVALGDTTIAAMLSEIPGSVFADNDGVFLRVWFDDGTNGSQQLAPDRRIVAVAYAMMAEDVPIGSIDSSKIVSGAVTASKIANGSISGSHMSAGAVSSLGAPGGGPESVVNVGLTGLTGVGTNQPKAGLHVSSAQVSGLAPAFAADAVDEVGGFTRLQSAWDVAAAGDYAYVTSILEHSLTIVNVSDSSNPALAAEIVDGQGGFNRLGGARGVAVSGNYAYVAAYNDHTLTIIDISDRANPTLAGEARQGVNGFTKLQQIVEVAVSGPYAYVVSQTLDAMTIIDVSDPANPAQVATVVDEVGGFTKLEQLESVAVSGNFVYITSRNDNALTIVDVSDPANPALAAEIVDGTGNFNRLASASGVAVSGGYAFVTSSFEGALTIIDVSDPSNPSLAAEIVDGVGGFNRLFGANGVTVSGDYVYVTSLLDDALTIIDVSSPSTPALVAEIVDEVGAFTKLEGARSVAVSGSSAYVASSTDNALTIIDLNPLNSVGLVVDKRVGIGNDEPATDLHIGTATDNFDRVLRIQTNNGDPRIELIADSTNGGGEDHNPSISFSQDGGLAGGVVGLAGDPGFNSLDQPYTDTTLNSLLLTSQYAIQFGTNGAVRLTVDGTNGRVGIGETAPSHLLHVNGVARSTQSAWATSSDRRAKENIEEIEGSLEKLSRLRPVQFDYSAAYRTSHEGYDGRHAGFIAQEVEIVFPEMVDRVSDGLGGGKVDDFRLLNTSGLDAHVVKAIQVLKTKNEEQVQQLLERDRRIKALEERLTRLEEAAAR